MQGISRVGGVQSSKHEMAAGMMCCPKKRCITLIRSAYLLVCLGTGLQLALCTALLPLAKDVKFLAGIQLLEGIWRCGWRLIRPRPVLLAGCGRLFRLAFAHCTGCRLNE